MSDKFNTPQLQASYGVGRNFADQLASNPFEGLDIEALIEGIRHSFNGQESVVAQADLENAFRLINEQMQAKQAEHKELTAEGEEYLAENAKREEIVVTDSGLQYEILQAGDKAIPTKEEQCVLIITVL